MSAGEVARLRLIRAGLAAHRADWDCTGHDCREYSCAVVVELLANLDAQTAEVADLQRQVAHWKMHAYDHGYQP